MLILSTTFMNAHACIGPVKIYMPAWGLQVQGRGEWLWAAHIGRGVQRQRQQQRRERQLRRRRRREDSVRGAHSAVQGAAVCACG